MQALSLRIDKSGVADLNFDVAAADRIISTHALADPGRSVLK
jgi:hypothetical protein